MSYGNLTGFAVIRSPSLEPAEFSLSNPPRATPAFPIRRTVPIPQGHKTGPRTSTAICQPDSSGLIRNATQDGSGFGLGRLDPSLEHGLRDLFRGRVEFDLTGDWTATGTLRLGRFCGLLFHAITCQRVAQVFSVSGSHLCERSAVAVSASLPSRVVPR